MLMYRIAICDDEKSTCAEIESYILMYSKLRFIRNEIEGKRKIIQRIALP